MNSQDTSVPKKRRGPAPTGQGTQVQVRLQPNQLEKVDAWRDRQDDKPTRPEAIRRLVDHAIGQD